MYKKHTQKKRKMGRKPEEEKKLCNLIPLPWKKTENPLQEKTSTKECSLTVTPASSKRKEMKTQ